MGENIDNPRPLNIDRLYVEKKRSDGKKVSVNNGDGGRLKRNGRLSASPKIAEKVDFQGLKKRKARKEVSLSSLEPVLKKRKKGLEDGIGSSSKPKKGEVSELLSVGNSKNSKENDSVKARALSNQKIQSNARGGRRGIGQVGTSNLLRKESKNRFGARRRKFSGNSSSLVEVTVDKGKNISNKFEENGLGGVKFVRFNGGFSLKRTRSDRRRRVSAIENLHVTVGSLLKNSATVCQNSTTGSAQVEIDDQENLEQNAARMLSSRFNPSCDGFDVDVIGSGSKSADGSPLPVTFRHDFGSLGSNSLLGLKKFSADGADRVLRPRLYKQNDNIKRRRRRFVEIHPGGLDAYWVLNRRIKVFRSVDENWYFGLVEKYDPETKLHHVKYDDRDGNWVSLQTERFKLLLFPGEIPCKVGSSHVEPCLEGVKHTDANGDANDGTSMESEPIISWLTRTNRRLNSPTLGALRTHKRSRLSKNTGSPNLLDMSISSPKEKLTLTIGSPVQERQAERDGHAIQEEQSCSTSSDNRKIQCVYFRKRFRTRGKSDNTSNKIEDGHTSFLASILAMVDTEKDFIMDPSGVVDLHANANKLLTFGKPETARDLSGNCDTSLVNFSVHDSMQDSDIGFDDPFDGFEHLGRENFLWSIESAEMLKPAVSCMDWGYIKLNITLPLLRVINFTSRVDRSWVYSGLLLPQFGNLIAAWPKVYLEILFVDNTEGLRFLLFDGCLGQATAFLCLIMATYKLSSGCTYIIGGPLPVTSVRFKLSGSQDPGRQLVFVLYNFSVLTGSRRHALDITLKRFCSITQELPLSECTRGNIEIFHSRRNRMLEVLIKKSKEDFTRCDNTKALSHVNISSPSHTYIDSHGKFTPFYLLFATAPTSFLGMHLKLLMGSTKGVSNSFQSCDLSAFQNDPENVNEMADDDSSDHVRETSFESMECSLGNCADSGCLSCSYPKVETDAHPISNDGDWTKKPLQQSLNKKLNVTGTSVGTRDLEKNDGDDSLHGNIFRLQRYPCHTGSWRYTGKSRSFASEVPPLLDEPETGCVSSCLSDVKVRSPLGVRKPQSSASELGWSMDDFATHGQKPTAPRSIWHRNRLHTVPPSSASRSNLWPNRMRDYFYNGSRKPRSQISGSFSFAGYESSSKPRTHHQKGRSLRRIKDDKPKKASEDCGSPRRYLESVSCDANVLVTISDRGWRERGAQVVLESLNHDEWIIMIKFAGSIKYSHKVHQIMQPGTANRYTHAMMWRGGKDWSLEFIDRGHWTIFKELHEECYNRNIRAASVKNIPIPGVRLIEDACFDAVAVPFVRSALKYFRQVGTEIDVAMNPSCVVYDMESDDEEWICKSRDSLDISEEMFERVMDTFEKVSYAQQRDDFTSDDILHTMDGVGSMEVLKAIFQHWQQKRRKKGMPLIRQFQPPLWEFYQQKVKEWELATQKLHNFANGCKEKVAMVEKPPMFAFCLKPRGLEAPNKCSKQRSQRRFGAWMHNNSFSKDHENFQFSGRKLNEFALGEEKSLVTFHDYESLDFQHRHHSNISPKGAGCLGTSSMMRDGSDQYQNLKLHRNKSQVGSTSSYDSPRFAMSANQRTMGKNGVLYRWKVHSPEWPSRKLNHPDGFLKHRGNQSSGSDCDESRLRDAEDSVKIAMDLAKFKREKAQRLFQKADLLLHKAVVALVTAEAIKASENDLEHDDKI